MRARLQRIVLEELGGSLLCMGWLVTFNQSKFNHDFGVLLGVYRGSMIFLDYLESAEDLQFLNLLRVYGRSIIFEFT